MKMSFGAVKWAVCVGLFLSLNLPAKGEVPLTSSPYNHSNPVWSPNGQWIAFDGGLGIGKITASGGSETSLTSGLDPVWSPDSTALLFTDYGPFFQPIVYSISASGGSRSQISYWSPDPDYTCAYGGSWSSSTGTVAINSCSLAHGTTVCEIPSYGGDCAYSSLGWGWNPVYSHAGDNLLWATGYVYSEPAILQTSFTTLVLDFEMGRYFYDYSWSNSDNTVLYTRDNGSGLTEIFSIPSTGGTSTLLVSAADNADSPSFNYTDEYIVFRERVSGVWQLFLMNADGSNQTQLTFDAMDKSSPKWSPNGNSIIYSKTDATGYSQIYQMEILNLDGKINPPTPILGYYGDADGDHVISGLDLIQHRNMVAGRTTTYDTLQPQSADAKWNTCDLDSDRSCTGLDLIILRNILAGNSVSIPDNDWVLRNPATGGLPPTILTSRVALFRMDVSSMTGASGRPGIPVVATIVSGGGSLGGRTCTPNMAGFRDQIASPGATCAMSVTQTDWTSSTTQGLTETGELGLRFYAPSTPGVTEILFTVAANPTLDMPEASVRLSIEAGGNHPPVFTSTCSTTAAEGQYYQCVLTGTDPDYPQQQLLFSDDPATNTCNGGILVAGSTYTYMWLPNSSEGGTTCVVGVKVYDNFVPSGEATQATTVTVEERNEPPVITSTCSTSATEFATYSCTLTATDPDIPAQTLTWSVGYGDFCYGTIVGSTYSFTPGEFDGGNTCNIEVIVSDGFPNTPGEDVQITTVIVAEVNNYAPYFGSTCGISATVGVQYSCYVYWYDNDYQPVTISVSPDDTCGGTMTGLYSDYYRFTPTAGQGGTTCVVGLMLSDSGMPVLTATQNTTVTVAAVNQPPVWTTQPANVLANNSEPYSAINGVASDTDLPNTGATDPGYLTCVMYSKTCTFTVTYTGSGSGSESCTLGFTVPASPSSGTCNVTLRARDGKGLYVAKTISITWPRTTWTWKAGDEWSDVSGTYGTLGVPDPANTPGSRERAVSWRDGGGNLLLFGGLGYGEGGYYGHLNDLWRWDGANWAWINGSKVSDQHGVYGTKGTPNAANVPGARELAISWTDSSGNLWLFGGYGFPASGAIGYLNDLWKWDGTNWTWVSGSNATNQYGVYGTKGVADPSNIPGARQGSISWKDSSGNLWLFGGLGYAVSSGGYLNDLWKWDGTNWTWVSGTNLRNQLGVYGTKGVANPSNVPGTRQNAISWTDPSSGNFWLFGGDGYSASGGAGYLNDLWKWDGANWTWISGSNTINQFGVYGTIKVPAAGNIPGSRVQSISWADSSGKLWLFGGYGYAGTGLIGNMNDLWRWDGTNWTWMSGSSIENQYGTYGIKGVPATTNVPGNRAGAVSWIDASGNFWLFGGFDLMQYGPLNDLWKYVP